MSGQDLRENMLRKAEAYDLRPLQSYEKRFLNFIATYVTDDNHQQLLFSILEDLAFRIFFTSAANYFRDSDSLKPDKIQEFLKEKTFLPEDDVKRIQQLLKGALTWRYAERPKNEVKKKIREKSTGNCYLCGLPVNDEHNESEIDHVWPHSLGGKNSKENLRLAHAECASIKADAATLGDVLIRGFAYISPPEGFSKPAYQMEFWPREVPDKNSFNRYRNNVFSSSLRLAILMKQEFKCFGCKLEFEVVGEAHMSNAYEPCEITALNARAYCETCLPKENLHE